MFVGIKPKLFKEEVSSLFEVSHVRIQKILHMFQNAILTIIISIYVGGLINKPFTELNRVKSDVVMIGEITLQIMLVILAVYYIRKFTRLVPFLLHYTKSYDPEHRSKDGEGLIGATIAFALAFFSTQTKIKDKIKYIAEKM